MKLSTRSCLSWLLAIVMCGPRSVFAQTTELDESQVRAMVLINLTKFIDWPAARTDQHSPFVICVAGNEQVGANLEGLLSGKTIQGRQVIVRRGVAPGQAETCHILYIAHPRRDELVQLSGGLTGASVLTVTEEHRTRSNAVIGLPLVDGHVLIEIDRPLAHRSSLTLSSHLLQIAVDGR